MIDLKKTFRGDELLYGDYESDFKNHVQKQSTTI